MIDQRHVAGSRCVGCTAERRKQRMVEVVETHAVATADRQVGGLRDLRETLVQRWVPHLRQIGAAEDGHRAHAGLDRLGEGRFEALIRHHQHREVRCFR